VADYLLDAGPLVGLLDADDQWHEWSRKVLGAIRGPVTTTECVLAEACHHLRAYRPAVLEVVRAVESGQIDLIPITSQHAFRIVELMASYPLMDLGDASLVVLSELRPKSKLVTLDRRDFNVYRRADGKRVPCVMPPA
jgi:uncharacterized protein